MGRGGKRGEAGRDGMIIAPTDDPELKALLSLCAASAALSVYRLG